MLASRISYQTTSNLIKITGFIGILAGERTAAGTIRLFGPGRHLHGEPSRAPYGEVNRHRGVDLGTPLLVGAGWDFLHQEGYRNSDGPLRAPAKTLWVVRFPDNARSAFTPPDTGLSLGGDDTLHTPDSCLNSAPRPFSPLNSHRPQGEMWGFGTSRPSSSPSHPFKDPLFGLMPDQYPVSHTLNAIITRFTEFTGFPYLLNFRDHRGDRAVVCKNVEE